MNGTMDTIDSNGEKFGALCLLVFLTVITAFSLFNDFLLIILKNQGYLIQLIDLPGSLYKDFSLNLGHFKISLEGSRPYLNLLF